MRGLIRRALPFLKSRAEILGKQAVNVATDMIDGKSFKESTKDRLKEDIKIFASQREASQQSGSGVRRRRRRQYKKSGKKSKKRKVNIFDLHAIRARSVLRVCQVRVGSVFGTTNSD